MPRSDHVTTLPNVLLPLRTDQNRLDWDRAAAVIYLPVLAALDACFQVHVLDDGVVELQHARHTGGLMAGIDVVENAAVACGSTLTALCRCNMCSREQATVNAMVGSTPELMASSR
jgi:hypothetical protein